MRNIRHQTKNKLLIAFIYLSFISCGNKKTKQDKTIEQIFPINNVSILPTISPKMNENSPFAENEVSEMGNSINCIYQDTKNNYWFASNGQGVYRYDGKTVIQFTTKEGLCDDQVLTIKEDRQGLLWFVTVGGISRFDAHNIDSTRNKKYFTTFPSKDSKRQIIDKDVKMDPNDLWFEAGGGAYKYDGESLTYLLLPKPNNDTKHINHTNPMNPDSRKLNAYSVYCTLKDKSGNLWLGTQTLGVCRYDGKSFTWFTDEGLTGPAVRGLFEDRNGTLWFGNNGNGLFSYDAKKAETHETKITNLTRQKGLDNPDFLKSGKSKEGTIARVWAINEDNNGNIWIGTYDSGVWLYDGKSLLNYTTKNGLSSNAINTIYKDKSGLLWFGTDGAGVCSYDGASFKKFHW